MRNKLDIPSWNRKLDRMESALQTLTSQALDETDRDSAQHTALLVSLQRLGERIKATRL